MNRQYPFSGMKLFCSFLFSLFILVICTKNAVLSLDYSLNRADYERVCENKNKPEMACHGKCKLQKNSKKENFSLSLKQYNPEFYPLQSLADFSQNNPSFTIAGREKISEDYHFFLPEISASILIPPPNI